MLFGIIEKKKKYKCACDTNPISYVPLIKIFLINIELNSILIKIFMINIELNSIVA